MDPTEDRRLHSAREGLSVKQAAEQLGMHTQTVYGWIREGLLPVTRIGPRGGLIRIHPLDLEDTVKRTD